MSSITNILVNIINEIGILHILVAIILRPILLGAPLILALVYIFFTSKKIYTKILLFLGAILCEMLLFNWLYADNLSFQEIQTRHWRYALVGFFLYCIITMIAFVQRSKKVFPKILSIVVISLIFGSLTIFYIEGYEIEWSDGSITYMRSLEQKFQEYVTTHNGCYPTYDEYYDEVSKNTSHHDRYYLGYEEYHGSPTSGFPYELTQKRYTTNDNPNLMVAWDKESHGVLLRWRYVIFVGKGEPEMKIVSEQKFQKLLKQQQGETNED